MRPADCWRRPSAERPDRRFYARPVTMRRPRSATIWPPSLPPWWGRPGPAPRRSGVPSANGDRLVVTDALGTPGQDHHEARLERACSGGSSRVRVDGQFRLPIYEACRRRKLGDPSFPRPELPVGAVSHRGAHLQVISTPSATALHIGLARCRYGRSACGGGEGRGGEDRGGTSQRGVDAEGR